MMSAKPPPPQRGEFMECQQLSKKHLNNFKSSHLKRNLNQTTRNDDDRMKKQHLT